METASFSVMVHVAVKSPSTVVTVMTTSPAETALTRPFWSTVACPLFANQVTFLLMALVGWTVAVSCRF